MNGNGNIVPREKLIINYISVRWVSYPTLTHNQLVG